MAKGDNSKAANAVNTAGTDVKDAAGAIDAALKIDASTAAADIKDDAKKAETETSGLLDKVEGDASTAVTDVKDEAEDFARDLSRGFGLLTKVRDAVRSAGAAAKVDADKALSELHDAIATLRTKIDAVGVHVEGDLGDFLAELKAHL